MVLGPHTCEGEAVGVVVEGVEGVEGRGGLSPNRSHPHQHIDLLLLSPILRVR